MFPCRGPVVPCRTLPTVSATRGGGVKPGFTRPVRAHQPVTDSVYQAQSRGGKTAEQLRLWLDGRVCYISLQYMAVIDNDDHARQKGTAESLVLAQLESRPRRGYDDRN
jgi:hypothetical protein